MRPRSERLTAAAGPACARTGWREAASRPRNAGTRRAPWAVPGPSPEDARGADAVDCARAREGALRLKLFPWLLSVLTRSDTHRGHLPFAQLGLSNYRETLV